MLKNNQLVKTGSLEFDFRIGRCANLGDELVFLCFSTIDDTERKRAVRLDILELQSTLTIR